MSPWRTLPLGDHVLAESPRWDAARRRLSWVDIVQGCVCWADRQDDGGWGAPDRFGLAGVVTAAVPSPEGWWVALGSGVVEVSADGVAVGPVHPVSPAFPDVRTNDMVLDPAGRLLVSLFTEDRTSPRGALVRLDPVTGTTAPVVDGVVTGNGMGFGRQGTRIYWVDTARGLVCAADYEPAGRAGAATVVVREPGPGRLDGLLVDRAGDVWVAVWDAGEVRRYAPDGTLRTVLDTPVARPSALALVDELLVVTTARRDLHRVDGEPAPDPAGRLYAYALT
jgi:sugar lactone lactonase YvrE